jgi:hypothetical protein
MILRNGQPYSPGTPFTNDEGTQFPGNWYNLASPEERTNQGFTEVPDPIVPDERFYYINTDGSITQKPLDQCKAVVVSQLASIRWSKENKGIEYTSANAMFQTDSASRVNYLGVLEIAKANSQYSTVWKARTIGNESQAKFVTINSNDIITIYYSGMDYISKCFHNEEQKNQNINTANSLSELLTIDLDANWPSNIY